MSYLARPPRGEAVYPLGRAARGVLEYSPEGNVSVRITGARAFSYHGYYTVDKKAGVLTHHLGLCSDHDLAGVSSLRHIGLEGARLVLSGSASLDGRPHALRVVWERQAQ